LNCAIYVLISIFDNSNDEVTKHLVSVTINFQRTFYGSRSRLSLAKGAVIVGWRYKCTMIECSESFLYEPLCTTVVSKSQHCST